MLGSHSRILTRPEPHVITPLAYLGFHDRVDAAPYDHINAAEAIRSFVDDLPNKERDYLEALRSYTDTLYGRILHGSSRDLFLDKTPAYALVLPFLTKLYPDASYVVLTRHPLAVMSSYANSFFGGDWRAANAYNPIVNRYIPAMARPLRERPVSLVHVSYEQLVADPTAQLERIFLYLGVDNEPGAVEYGKRFQTSKGMGDPIGVGQHERPVSSSLSKWVEELKADPHKRALAEQIVERLEPADLCEWGYTPRELLEPLSETSNGGSARLRPKTNSYVLQRRVLLALRKQVRKQPLGRLVRRVRYACDVLLRDSL
ncbi:MAG: sulfotransferase [Proteobacteria bacterium]|nr:sulfotransferase [Pseudomonadota bacterium]